MRSRKTGWLAAWPCGRARAQIDGRVGVDACVRATHALMEAVFRVVVFTFVSEPGMWLEEEHWTGEDHAAAEFGITISTMHRILQAMRAYGLVRGAADRAAAWPRPYAGSRHLCRLHPREAVLSPPRRGPTAPASVRVPRETRAHTVPGWPRSWTLSPLRRVRTTRCGERLRGDRSNTSGFVMDDVSRAERADQPRYGRELIVMPGDVVAGLAPKGRHRRAWGRCGRQAPDHPTIAPPMARPEWRGAARRHLAGQDRS
jgi:hypothetical protein